MQSTMLAVYHQYKRAGSTDLLIVPLSHSLTLELTDKVDAAANVSPSGEGCTHVADAGAVAAMPHTVLSTSPSQLAPVAG